MALLDFLFENKKESNDTYKNCVELSLGNALAWKIKNKTPVRIIIQKIDKDKNIDHAQAEYYNKDDDTWVPLTENWDADNSRMVVKPYKRHYNVEPYRTIDPEQFFNEQMKNK